MVYSASGEKEGEVSRRISRAEKMVFMEGGGRIRACAGPRASDLP